MTVTRTEFAALQLLVTRMLTEMAEKSSNPADMLAGIAYDLDQMTYVGLERNHDGVASMTHGELISLSMEHTFDDEGPLAVVKEARMMVEDVADDLELTLPLPFSDLKGW